MDAEEDVQVIVRNVRIDWRRFQRVRFDKDGPQAGDGCPTLDRAYENLKPWLIGDKVFGGPALEAGKCLTQVAEPPSWSWLAITDNAVRDMNWPRGFTHFMSGEFGVPMRNARYVGIEQVSRFQCLEANRPRFADSYSTFTFDHGSRLPVGLVNYLQLIDSLFITLNHYLFFQTAGKKCTRPDRRPCLDRPNSRKAFLRKE